jgi:hypothetical protein
MNEPNVRNLADADLTVAVALPAAPGTVVSGSVDLGDAPHVSGAELRFNSPALNATELPDGESVTYAVEESDDDVSFTSLCTVGAVTGAAGAGAAAESFRFAPASTGARYHRLSAVSSAGAGDQSGSSAEIQIVV